MNNMSLDALLLEYADRFGENFPIMLLMGEDENVIKNLIRQSIKTGTRYIIKNDGANNRLPAR